MAGNTSEGVMKRYLREIEGHLGSIAETESANLDRAARMLADHIKNDKLLFVYGPGGHSNLGTQEIFFRAGGLMHVNPILDEGTLLSSGALRSMAMERLPGYGRIVLRDSGIGKGDLILIVNAYGINSATIDAALYSKEVGADVIAVTSVQHASSTSPDHPARHPSKKNLHEVADVTLDCKVKVGDAVLELEGVTQKIAAMSTFANAYLLNCLVAEAVRLLAGEGEVPPIWRSGNAPGGDEWNQQFIGRFKDRIRCL